MTRIATLAARLLSALCMLTVVLAWAGFAFGTESTWWIELARYLPYPVLVGELGKEGAEVRSLTEAPPIPS